MASLLKHTPRRIAVAVLLAGALAAALPVPARAARQVTYRQLRQQLRSGPLIRVIVNVRGKDAEIKFTNLDEWRAYYPPDAQTEIVRLARARHIKLKFAGVRHRPAAAAAVHHHLRYIAAGVLAAVLLAAGGAWLYSRRSREPASAPPAR